MASLTQKTSWMGRLRCRLVCGSVLAVSTVLFFSFFLLHSLLLFIDCNSTPSLNNFKFKRILFKKNVSVSLEVTYLVREFLSSNQSPKVITDFRMTIIQEMNENIYIKVQKENKKALLTSFTCCKVGNTGNDVKKYHSKLKNYFNCLPIPFKI